MLLVPEDRAACDTESLEPSPLGMDGETKALGDKAVTQQDVNRGGDQRQRAQSPGSQCPLSSELWCDLATASSFEEGAGKGKDFLPRAGIKETGTGLSYKNLPRLGRTCSRIRVRVGRCCTRRGRARGRACPRPLGLGQVGAASPGERPG